MNTPDPDLAQLEIGGQDAYRNLGATMGDRIRLVKVFSATTRKGRASLGERVSDWIAANPRAQISKTIVSLTSDREYHCLSIVLICGEHA
jgi:hypothetical protein